MLIHGKHRQIEPSWWHEPVRILLTAVWVVALTLWVYPQVLILYRWYNDYGAIPEAAIILPTVHRLWWTSFLAALAFGLGWYCFSYLIAPMSRGPVHAGVNRLTRAQACASLCIGICTFLFIYRMMPIWPTVGIFEFRLSPVLHSYAFGDDWGFRIPGLDLWSPFVGFLASVLLFLRAWGTVPLLGGKRLNLVLLTSGLVTANLVVSGTGLLYKIPTSVPKEMLVLARTDPLQKGLLKGDDRYESEASRTIHQYLKTHDGSGESAPYTQVIRNSLRSWWDDPLFVHHSEYFYCELCQLPCVRYWAISGIRLKLGPDVKDVDSEPSHIIEIPRHPDPCRLYGVEPPAAIESLPVSEALSRVSSTERVILKIDIEVKMGFVSDLLQRLKEGKVQLVDLAVVPFDYQQLESAPRSLIIGDEDDGFLYVPRERQGREWRYIVVRKYVPPSKDPDPRPVCVEVVDRDYRYACMKWMPEPPGSLPERVKIKVGSKQKYGDFIGILQGAVAGGAEEINLVPEVDEDDSGVPSP